MVHMARTHPRLDIVSDQRWRSAGQQINSDGMHNEGRSDCNKCSIAIAAASSTIGCLSAPKSSYMPSTGVHHSQQAPQACEHSPGLLREHDLAETVLITKSRCQCGNRLTWKWPTERLAFPPSHDYARTHACTPC
jgi:hypothetical protein